MEVKFLEKAEIQDVRYSSDMLGNTEIEIVIQLNNKHCKSKAEFNELSAEIHKLFLKL